jgi:hypothetical protein
MNTSNDFERGYACAVATKIRMDGGNTAEKELLEAMGWNSVSKIKKANIDAYDLEVLIPFMLQEFGK